GEGRLGNDSAEIRLDFKRLKQLRRTHGFAEAKNAVILAGTLQPLKPLLDIVALHHPEGGNLAATHSVRAGIRHEHAVAVLKKDSSVARHAETVAPHAVKQNDRVTIPGQLPDIPSAK